MYDSINRIKNKTILTGLELPELKEEDMPMV